MILLIGGGLFVWKKNVGGSTVSASSFQSISKEEIELLLKDLAKQNPMALKRFEQDPEMKQKQLESIKQLLAFATQAQRDGLAADPNNREELKNIADEVAAVNYDKEVNKDKGPMPPFGFISEDQTNAFWAEGGEGQGYFAKLKNKVGLGSEDPEIAFQRFLDSKLAVLRASNPAMKDHEITEEERTQARDFFAKIAIYKNEFEQKAAAGELDKEFVDKVRLQTKLQQAQFLAKLYSAKLTDDLKVTDEDVSKYIADHPELVDPGKKAKAEEVLNRAKSGEDFAKLANEFTEDPGNKGAKGESLGGLYKDVTKGGMVKPFEDAALALEPGQVAPNLVETDFGYHIMKLERKGEGKDSAGQPAETYDVRHILFSTSYKDPSAPGAQEMPLKAYVRNKLETEKEKAAVDKIIADNNISVPADFDIPQVSDEQIQDMIKRQQQMQQMPPGAAEPGEGAPPPPANAPADGQQPPANTGSTGTERAEPNNR